MKHRAVKTRRDTRRDAVGPDRGVAQRRPRPLQFRRAVHAVRVRRPAGCLIVYGYDEVRQLLLCGLNANLQSTFVFGS